MNYIVYDESGTILRTGTCPESPAAMKAQAGKDEFVMRGIANDALHRIENGKVVARQPDAPREITYAERRHRAYPPIHDQLDALWHAMADGTLPMVPDFFEPNAAVKAAHPKPKE